MRSTFWLKGISICALIVSLCVPVRADDGSTAPVNYASGDIAVSTAACGPLCATITLANGDTVKILAGRATGCAPYMVTSMRYHGGQLGEMWTTALGRDVEVSHGSGGCGFLPPFRYKVIDGVDMGVYTNAEGALFMKFFPKV